MTNKKAVVSLGHDALGYTTLAQLDAVKTKRLLKEFEVYVEAKKVKNARLEALRAGFKECYKNHEFATIVSVGNKLPEELLTTDEVLLRFYDIASSRV